MNEPKLEQDDDGHLHLSGDLNFYSVPALALNSRRVFNHEGDINIDLDGINRADSAGVALLVEWQRKASSENRAIRFNNIPSQMLAIARLSGVDDLLSLA